MAAKRILKERNDSISSLSSLGHRKEVWGKMYATLSESTFREFRNNSRKQSHSQSSNLDDDQEEWEAAKLKFDDIISEFHKE